MANHMNSRHKWSKARVRAHMREDLAQDFFLEAQLMMLAMAAGINDATTFPDYRIFASNQTGNTVLLAVGAFNLASNFVDLQNVGFSLGMFILGGLVFGQMGCFFGRTRRGWLFWSNVTQTSLVLGAAALRQWYNTEEHGQSPSSWSVISFLALASGAQVAMARTVNVPEVTTAMVTSAYIDFLVDPDIFQLRNRPRNRRFFFVVSLLTGSFVGAGAYRYVSPAFALLLAGICKALVSITILFNKPSSNNNTTGGPTGIPSDHDKV